jgi:hypothetical protein
VEGLSEAGPGKQKPGPCWTILLPTHPLACHPADGRPQHVSARSTPSAAAVGAGSSWCWRGGRRAGG